MSDVIEQTIENIESKTTENKDIQRKKRFAEYTVRSVNQKVCQQIMRDFTVDTEDRLFQIANSVNADEANYDLRDVLERWFLNTFIGKYLKKIIDKQKSICDAYNYFGKTIKKIFKQARRADCQFANKIGNKPNTIATGSVGLLTKLNSAFVYYDHNKEYGCDMKYALNNIYENDDETDMYIDSMVDANKSYKIEDFVEDEENVKVFDKYSKKIYKIYFSEDSSQGIEFSKIIKGHEGTINRIVSYLLDKLYEQSGKSMSDVIDAFFEDKDVTKLLTQLIDATGATGTAKGVLKIYILMQLKEQIYKNYQALFNKIHANKSDDYETLKMLYKQLKDLETKIIDTYKEINEFNPDKQVKANEWLGEVECQDCGE